MGFKPEESLDTRYRYADGRATTELLRAESVGAVEEEQREKFYVSQ
jgi:hypothetical protein